VTFVIGIPLLAGTSGPDLGGGDYAGVIAGGLLTVVLCAALGVGVGTLLRNQVGAVVGLLVWIFVFEPLVTVANDDWRQYTIGTAAGALGQGGNVDSRRLTAAVVLTAWTVLFCTAGAIVDRRRDVE
jgi:ABC-2 type transport system permease protein